MNMKISEDFSQTKKIKRISRSIKSYYQDDIILWYKMKKLKKKKLKLSIKDLIF